MSYPIQVYLAAVYTNSYMPGGNRYPKLNPREVEIMAQVKEHNILESWHYVGKDKYVANMRENNAKIFLDSGAFSAFTLGVKLSVEDYCNYIRRNQDIIRVEDGDLMASVLDGIGDPQETFENQMHMERLGVRPLPCFHAGEDERYLEWYIANYDYITLGGMVGQSVKQLEIWLDRMWDKYLTDGSGNPRLKVHGFGITSTPLMEKYPWYSCDSSSWIQAAAFGAIVTPAHGPMSVSDQSPSRHDAGQHIDSLSKIEHDYIVGMLREQGFEKDRLATIYESRAVYNMYGYMQINHNMNKNRADNHKNLVGGLF